VSVSMRRADLDDFARYLTFNGATIEEPTNQWEVLRYRMPRVGTIVIYTNARGELTIPPAASKHFMAFKRGRFIEPEEPIGEVKRKSKLSGSRRHDLRTILKLRDGEWCCVCGQALDGDETIEHWLSQDHGGIHVPANLALAHKACNALLDNLPVIQKFKFIMEIRTIVSRLAPDEKFDPERHAHHLLSLSRKLKSQRSRAATAGTPGLTIKADGGTESTPEPANG